VKAASSERLQLDIVETFPKLQNIEFELLKANSSGQKLVRILQNYKIPDLVHINSLRIGIIYIRPMSNLVSKTQNNY